MVKAKQARAALEFTFRSMREAEAVLQAIIPEERLPTSTRCKVCVERRKNVLCLRVEAGDTVALRAALNSFVRWIIVARDMIGKGGK